MKVCDRGWADGQLRLDVANIRNQLEMLYTSTPEPKLEPDSSTTQDSEPLNPNALCEGCAASSTLVGDVSLK